MGTWRIDPVSMTAASPLLTGDSGLLHTPRGAARARGPPRPRPSRSPPLQVLLPQAYGAPAGDPRAHSGKKGEAMRQHRPSAGLAQ